MRNVTKTETKGLTREEMIPQVSKKQVSGNTEKNHPRNQRSSTIQKPMPAKGGRKRKYESTERKQEMRKPRKKTRQNKTEKEHQPSAFCNAYMPPHYVIERSRVHRPSRDQEYQRKAVRTVIHSNPGVQHAHVVARQHGRPFPTSNAGIPQSVRSRCGT
jgi:hypothetical protein